MSSSYDDAVQALYRAPHESFVVERQRLVTALKAAGDKLAAARLAKRSRPTISAWAVNQLWWHSQAAFEDLFETANQLRAGKLAASGAHRKAVTHLTSLAQKLLTEAGHAASEATLRRIAMTLSGLAAAGGFDPESAGALTKDRDPPGFAAFGLESSGHAEPAPTKANATHHDDAERKPARADATAESARAREAAAAAAAAEQRRAAEQRAEREAGRRQLDEAVRDARGELAARERERERLAQELAASERKVEQARAALHAAAARRAAFDG